MFLTNAPGLEFSNDSHVNSESDEAVEDEDEALDQDVVCDWGSVDPGGDQAGSGAGVLCVGDVERYGVVTFLCVVQGDD